jgi:hypothetical protein
LNVNKVPFFSLNQAMLVNVLARRWMATSAKFTHRAGLKSSQQIDRMIERALQRRLKQNRSKRQDFLALSEEAKDFNRIFLTRLNSLRKGPSLAEICEKYNLTFTSTRLSSDRSEMAVSWKIASLDPKAVAAVETELGLKTKDITSEMTAMAVLGTALPSISFHQDVGMKSNLFTDLFHRLPATEDDEEGSKDVLGCDQVDPGGPVCPTNILRFDRQSVMNKVLFNFVFLSKPAPNASNGSCRLSKPWKSPKHHTE